MKNHSKVMVLKVSDAELKQQLSEEEEKKKNQNESIQRTQKGFQILSERGNVRPSVRPSVCDQAVGGVSALTPLCPPDGSEDPDTTPVLEIADQRGNPLKIPHKEKKVGRRRESARGVRVQVHQNLMCVSAHQALILAMGFHEKGRSLMKKKQFDNALCHLLQADQQFR